METFLKICYLTNEKIVSTSMILTRVNILSATDCKQNTPSETIYISGQYELV